MNHSVAPILSFPIGKTGRKYLPPGCWKGLLHVGLRGAESQQACSPVGLVPALHQALESILAGRCLFYWWPNDLEGALGSKSHDLSSNYLLQPQHLLHVPLRGFPPVLGLQSPATGRSSLWRTASWGTHLATWPLWPAALQTGSHCSCHPRLPECWGRPGTDVPSPRKRGRMGARSPGEPGERASSGSLFKGLVPDLFGKLRLVTHLLMSLYLSVREAGYF